MEQTGSTAVVYSDALNPSVKIKHLRGTLTREVMDREVFMLRSVPPNICASIVSYKYPEIQLQRMDESVAQFISRKQPPLETLIAIIDIVGKKCMILYARGIFHADLMLNNVMLLYRTPCADPMNFLIDVGISLFRNEHLEGLPRVPDSADKEYDFCYFLYSLLSWAKELFDRPAFDALYNHLSPFIPTIRRYFEKYHSSGRNHQWYRAGTLWKCLGWKISLEES